MICGRTFLSPLMQHCVPFFTTCLLVNLFCPNDISCFSDLLMRKPRFFSTKVLVRKYFCIFVVVWTCHYCLYEIMILPGSFRCHRTYITGFGHGPLLPLSLCFRKTIILFCKLLVQTRLSALYYQFDKRKENISEKGKRKKVEMK